MTTQQTRQTPLSVRDVPEPLRKYWKMARKQGWTGYVLRRHPAWKPPGRPAITMPRTIRPGHSLQNYLKQLQDAGLRI